MLTDGPRDPLSLQGAALRGDHRAKVALVEYSDFRCPHCAAFAHTTLREIDRVYVSTGRLLLAFRQLPLPIHDQAELAAEASECARAQGRFWDMHDALFDLPTVSGTALNESARQLRLNLADFDSCIAHGQMREKVRADAANAAMLKINGTPTFFMGTVAGNQVKVLHRVNGSASFDVFAEAIDSLLKLTP